MPRKKTDVIEIDGDAYANIPEEVIVRVERKNHPYRPELMERVEKKDWLYVQRRELGNERSAFNVSVPEPLRLMLEEELSTPDVPISLKATSSFWDDKVYKPHEKPVLRPRDNYEDLISWFVLKANGDVVAFSEEEFKNHKPDAQYVCTNEAAEAELLVDKFEDEVAFQQTAFSLEESEMVKIVAMYYHTDLSKSNLTTKQIKAKYITLLKGDVPSRVRFFVNNRNIIGRSHAIMLELLKANGRFQMIDSTYFWNGKVVGKTPEDIAVKIQHPEYAELATILFN